MTHELKTLPAYWDAVERGDKKFEVRRDDRGFAVGDMLRLVRFAKNSMTGEWRVNQRRALTRRVTYILQGGQFGIEPGFVVMQLERLEGVK